MEILKAIDHETRSAMSGYRNPDRTPEFAHFAPYGAKTTVGDVVVCQTGNVHPWSVGIVKSISPDGHEAMLQELGGDRLCRVSNEAFEPIYNLSPTLLRYGDEYEFDQKVRRAFWCESEYWYRYGGVEFDKKEATIFVREAFGGMPVGDWAFESIPFPVKMRYNKRTSIAAIGRALRVGGLGTRLFDRVPVKKGESNVAIRETDTRPIS